MFRFSLHLTSVEYEPVELIVNALTFPQHSLFDLVVWSSNIARFPLHLSPCWSIGVSSAHAYKRGRLKLIYQLIYHIFFTSFLPILEINVNQHFVQNLHFAHLSSSRGAAEERKETLT